MEECSVDNRCDIVMDPKIWKEFPEVLFESVLSRLPIATFFQFRAVCRKWNALIDSDTFARCCTEVCSQTEPWFYAVSCMNYNSPQLYDPCLKKWHQTILIPSLTKKKVFMPVASAGGLVCLVDPINQYIYVSNPLTKSFRELPARFMVFSRPAVGMILNGQGYKIMWLISEGQYEVYDSLRMDWTKPRTIPSNIKLPQSLDFISKSVAIHNTLYFMFTDPGGILSYDMVSEKWKQYIIPFPPHSSDHALAECGERLLLVGMVTKNAATCVCIWELEKVKLLWQKVDIMPNEWCLDENDFFLDCQGNKGCLILLNLFSRQFRMNRLVTYNVVTREWTNVLGCTLPVGIQRCGRVAFLHGTAFHPSPTAKA